MNAGFFCEMMNTFCFTFERVMQQRHMKM